MADSIKILKSNGDTATPFGSFDYTAFDHESFDCGQSYAYTFKLSKPMSFKLARNNATSFSIKMRLGN